MEADKDSRAFIEGSSPKTSSPMGALIIDSSIAIPGWVTVSERKSIIDGEDKPKLAFFLC
jgi:hypothetical protein